MDQTIDIKLDRKIAVNSWIIKARWFYIVGILIIGVMTKILSRANPDFSYDLMYSFSVIAVIINIVFLLFHKSGARKKSERYQNVLGILQLVFELLIVTIITHYAGGIESVALIFYFLPVVAASLLFGLRGSLIVAVTSSFLLNFLMLYEHFGIIPHINRYGVESFEFSILRVSLTKSVTISMMYVIVGFFAGFGSRQLFEREDQLKEKSETLRKQTENRERELKELDKTTKLLVRRDTEMTNINAELDKKVKDLKKAERSMLKAFDDLKNERRKAEEERSKTEAIIANLIDPIIVLDADDKIALYNPSAALMFGITGNSIGKNIPSRKNFSFENFREHIKSPFKIVKTGQVEGQEEEEIEVETNGQEFTYKAITASVKGNDGSYLGKMKVFYNLTREKMIDRMKSEFISIAAHQLRTPLSAIKWVMKMVLDGDAGKLTDEQIKLLNKGYDSNERIIQLVNDMLNVSRIEEGRFGYSFKKDDLLQAIDMAIDNLSLKFNSKKINLVYDKPKKIPQIYVDIQKMGLAMQNLLDNAVKYTPERGKVEIKIDKKQKNINVVISDNGVGIPEKDQGKLFTKFFRAENVQRMQSEGSGLGLFMVKNIIKKHGGDLTFKSVEGKGTEFTVTLPTEKPIILE